MRVRVVICHGVMMALRCWLAFRRHGPARGVKAKKENNPGRWNPAVACRIIPLPLQVEDVPDRPTLLLELGEPFLGTGSFGPEVELPTGAVWRPSLWVFGTHRMAVQTVDNGATRVSEWAHRLDLFANLKLSASDRLLIGLRPLDRENRFTSVSFEPAGDFQDEFNAVVRTLFFEGDAGEIFPNLDSGDTRMLDIGFSVGRQAVLFQDGILINSGGLGNPDAVSLVRNNLQLPARQTYGSASSMPGTTCTGTTTDSIGMPNSSACYGNGLFLDDDRSGSRLSRSGGGHG